MAASNTQEIAEAAVSSLSARIEGRYLLLIMIPCWIDRDGQRYVDPLWYKDLMAHLPHIPKLTLACPTRPIEEGQGDLIPLGNDPGLRFVDLPPCRTLASALATLPRAMSAVWQALGDTDILQAHVGGWPISYGWFAVPMAKLRGRFVLMNVEAAGWRLDLRFPWGIRRLRRLIEGLVFEVMGRLCVNLSDLMTCTNVGYRDGLLVPWRRHRGHVFVATWIDPEFVLDRVQAEALWNKRLVDPPRPLRVVYAGQLTRLKGVEILLEALRRLEGRLATRVQIYGRGELESACHEVATRMSGPLTVEMKGTLSYGLPFFEMFDDQDVLIIPSLSDEQPRNVYDAYARAVPVIGSDTLGLRQCVEPGETGWLVPADDPEALAQAIMEASQRRDTLRAMGLAGLALARSTTHDQMHARRAEVIRQSYDAWCRGQPNRQRPPRPD